MPFDKPYVEPEDLDVSPEATPEDPDRPDEDHPAEDLKTRDGHKQLKYKMKTKTHDHLKTEDRPKPAEDTSMTDPDRTYPDPDHSGPVTRSKRRRAAVLNVWDLAQSE